MKNIFIGVFFILIISSGCMEVMPTVLPVGTITSDRVVLLEEFTGVGCSGCPAGSAEIENLLSIYPDNLIAVSIHAGHFASESQWNANQRYDLRSPDGERLAEEYFGGVPPAFPSATINRELSETNRLYVLSERWSSSIAKELAEGSSVDLKISRFYDKESRKLEIDLTVLALSALPADVRVSVIITESGIVDYQVDNNAPGDGWIPEYVHKHVLRDMITPFDGKVISSSGIALTESLTKSFSTVLPDNFVAENCEVIAFVHKNTSETKEVLQAIKVHVIE